MSQTELQGSVAGSVVSITENYLNLLSLGRTPAEALTEIDDFRSRMNGGQIRNRNSLLDYVRDRIRLDHKGYNLSELYLEEFIRRTQSFYF